MCISIEHFIIKTVGNVKFQVVITFLLKFTQNIYVYKIHSSLVQVILQSTEEITTLNELCSNKSSWRDFSCLSESSAYFW